MALVAGFGHVDILPHAAPKRPGFANRYPDTIERHLARQIAGGLELHPSAPPAEAFTQNIHGTVGYWRLTDRLDETAATIQAEHVILAGT